MDKYKNFAINIAKQSGDIMKDNFMSGIGKEWKSDNTPVTIVDTQINKLLINEIKKRFPGHSVLGEEESNFVVEAKMVWVCDPLDGTWPFSHNIPLFTFSLALVNDGQPILGVVYDPMLDRLFFASKGEGSFLNDKKILVSKANSLQKASVNVEGPRKIFGIDKLDIMKELNKGKCKTYKFVSVIYGAMLVASGEFIGSVFINDTCHDMAAIKIIMEEAGGRVTDIDGNEQRYDQKIKGAVVSNGLVHDKMIEIISKLKN